MERLWFLLGKYLLECSNKCTLCFFVWLIISLFLIKLVKDNLYCLPRKEQLLLKSIYSTFTLTTIRENKDSLVIHWINKGNYFSENDDILRIIRFGTEFQLGHLLNELANESEGKQTTPGDLPSGVYLWSSSLIPLVSTPAAPLESAIVFCTASLSFPVVSLLFVLKLTLQDFSTWNPAKAENLLCLLPLPSFLSNPWEQSEHARWWMKVLRKEAKYLKWTHLQMKMWIKPNKLSCNREYWLLTFPLPIILFGSLFQRESI